MLRTKNKLATLEWILYSRSEWQYLSAPRHENKTKHRANIKFCFKLGKTPTQTYEMSKQVYQDNCLSRARVFEWFVRFRNGKKDLENDKRQFGASENDDVDGEFREKGFRQILTVDSNANCANTGGKMRRAKFTVRISLRNNLDG